MFLTRLENAHGVDCLSLNVHDHKSLASGGQAGTLFCNEAVTGKLIWSLDFNGSEGSGIGAVCFHPIQEHSLFVAVGNKVLQLDTRKLIQDNNPGIANPLIELSIAEDEINSLDICSRGRLLATGDDEGHIHIVDLLSSEKQICIAAHENICSAVCFSPYAENELFSGGLDCHVKSWDTETGSVFWDDQMHSRDGHLMMNPPMVHGIACPEDSLWNGLVASARGDATVFLRTESEDDESLSTLLYSDDCGHTFSVSCICFLKCGNGDKLMSAGDDKKVILWDWTADTDLLIWRRMHSDKINAIRSRAVSEQNEHVYLGCESGIYSLSIT